MKTTNEKTEFNGLFFDASTCEQVRRAVSHAFAHGLRVRVFYGDTDTGRAWPEEWDTMGTIGRSTGSQKIPLLIHSARSMGGGALLDSRIVAIKLTNGGGFLYRHSSFDPGPWGLASPVSPGYCEAVTHAGAIHAQFKKPGQARRYIAYMTGDRFSK
ncbi:hypothetical protein [Fluviibacter phosphoraccumulans]